MYISASEHRTTAGPSTIYLQVSQSENPSQTDHTPFMESELFLFPTAFKSALQSIQDSPLHNLFGKPPLSDIAAFCEHFQDALSSFQALFATLVNLSIYVNITTTADREDLFEEIHRIRTSILLRDLEGLLRQNECPHPKHKMDFLHVVVLEITEAFYWSDTMMRWQLHQIVLRPNCLTQNRRSFSTTVVTLYMH